MPKYVIATCNDQSVVEALPNVLGGSIETTTSPGGESADTKLYAAILQKYAADKGIDPDPTKSSGISLGLGTIMNFASGMKGFTGDVTPANVGNQFQDRARHAVLVGRAHVQCDGTAIPLLKNICSSTLLIGTVNNDGTVKDTKKIDPTALFKS